MIKINVKCRHDLEFSVPLAGSWGEISSNVKMIVNCPYEQDCKVGKQPCYDDCMLFAKEPYCATTCARVK